MNQCNKGHLIFKPTCSSCKQLQNQWHQKLEQETDFVDIEDGDRLIDHRSILDLVVQQDFQTTEVYNAKITYYQWARDKASDGVFACWRDRLIWDYHSEGMTHRLIGSMVGMEHSWISRKIQKIKDYMKDNTISSMSAQLVLGF